MAGEIVYADLNIPSEPHSSRLLDPSQQLSTALSSRWLLITLCIGNVILVAAVITLALQLEAEKGKPGTEAGGSTGTGSASCNASLENFQSRLRSRFCIQNQTRSSVNSTCKLCPADWRHHKDKCYWPSTEIKSWNESRNYCSAMDSQLLVLQDKEEMEFIKNITVSGQRYWIGLYLSILPEKKWVWITGLQIDPSLFQEPMYTAENNCGLIKDKINSDTCRAEFMWICQKGSISL